MLKCVGTLIATVANDMIWRCCVPDCSALASVFVLATRLFNKEKKKKKVSASEDSYPFKAILRIELGLRTLTVCLWHTKVSTALLVP